MDKKFAVVKMTNGTLKAMTIEKAAKSWGKIVATFDTLEAAENYAMDCKTGSIAN